MVRLFMTERSKYPRLRKPSFDGERQKSKSRYLPVLLVILVIVIASVFILAKAKPDLFSSINDSKTVQTVQQTKPAAKEASSTASTQKTTANTSTSTAATAVNMCVGNNLDQFILVSISQRHLWVCDQTKQLYDSPVVTGMENLAADLTPTGTYHIYAKETDVYLKGSDSTGSWDDYVNYWMPFLNNQYGTYGFHDATWRPANAFGNISPYSSNASHGCVELPLATAKWLYNWAQIGTTLTVQS